MALIIETGTGLPDADSYATASDLAAYAGNYGFMVPAVELEREALLRRAALQMNVLLWKGERANEGQALAWPRSGVVVDGRHIAADSIPRGIQYGQMALACEIHVDELSPPDSRQGAVVREKVDVVEVQYAEIKNTGALMPAAPDRQSRAQFADYLLNRGWFAIRA